MKWIKVLDIHETLVLVIVNLVAGSAFCLAAYADTFLAFLITYFFTSIRGCNYGTGRALQTKVYILIF